MSSTLFDLECDRLVRLADPADYEQFRWERQEGAVLTSLLGRIRGAFAHRTEFIIQEIETDARSVALSIGPSEEADKQYFVLVLAIEGADLVIRASSGQNYSFTYGQVHTAQVNDLSDEWLEKVLRAILANVQRREAHELRDLLADDSRELSSPAAAAEETQSSHEPTSEIHSPAYSEPQWLP